MAGFSSLMLLVPSEHVAFFLANQFEGSHVRDQVKDALLKALFPAARERHPVPPPPPDFAARAHGYEGNYIPMNSCMSCKPLKAPFVLNVTQEDSSLSISGRRWIECDPTLFVRSDGLAYLAFRSDSSGSITEMHPGSFWSFVKVP